MTKVVSALTVCKRRIMFFSFLAIGLSGFVDSKRGESIYIVTSDFSSVFLKLSIGEKKQKIKGNKIKNIFLLFKEKKIINNVFFSIVCDNGWMAYKNYCYRFSNNKLTFSEAVVSFLYLDSNYFFSHS